MKEYTPWYIKIALAIGACVWLGGVFVAVHFITKYW